MKRSTKERIAGIALFIIIAIVMFGANKFNDWFNEKLINKHIEQAQIQEMIDYHRSEGREIIVFN